MGKFNHIEKANSRNVLEEIKDHPNNAVYTLLKECGWSPKKEGSTPAGQCITGHTSESGTCMTVYIRTNSCYCFNCQNYFDAISVTMHLKSYEFKQALECLADRAGIKISSAVTEEERANFASTERTLLVLENAVQIWQENLLKNTDMMTILNSRYGLNTETIKKARLGYSTLRLVYGLSIFINNSTQVLER